jgi:hypothetical protein
MTEVISKSSLKYLPFKAEAINHWKDDTDLAKFLQEIFGPLYTSHAIDRFWEGVEEAKKLAGEFSIISLHVYHQNQEKIIKRKQDFLNDSNFGRAAKAIVAWRGIDEEMLSEGVFVSIHHTLEAASDLDCSIALVKMHYYKQAGYCLRTFLENVTLPLLFSQYPARYGDWKKDGFRIPRFRGKDGLLASLVLSGAMSIALSERISELYDELNAFVHSSITSLIHSGHETGNWRGLSFKLDEIYKWCGLISECVEVGIHLAQIQTDIWLKKLNSNPDICTICHSEKNFDVKQLPWANDDSLFEFICKQCGHKWYRRQSQEVCSAKSA